MASEKTQGGRHSAEEQKPDFSLWEDRHSMAQARMTGGWSKGCCAACIRSSLAGLIAEETCLALD